MTDVERRTLRTVGTVGGLPGLVLALRATSGTTAFALVSTLEGETAIARVDGAEVQVVALPVGPDVGTAEGTGTDEPPSLVVVDGRAGVWHAGRLQMASFPDGGFTTVPTDGTAPSARGMRAGGVSGPSDVGRVPILWQDGPVRGRTCHVAVLTLDPAGGPARWEQPVVLDVGDFPPTFLEGDHPVVKAAAVHGGRLVVAAAGPDDAAPERWGMAFLDIAEVGDDGRVTRTIRSFGPFKESLGAAGPRQGWYPRFSSSGAYCLLEPMYPAGEWVGRPGLVDLATGELSLVAHPRGVAGASLVDHTADGSFWFLDPDRGNRVTIARTR